MREHAISQFELRAAEPGDLQAIARLLEISDLPVEGVKDSLDGFIVAFADHRVIGVAGVERCADYGLLRSVAVDPDWRGAGIGGALVDRAIIQADAAGFASLYLLTTTAEKYFPAFGFEKIDRNEAPAPIRSNPQFTDLCPSSATVMRLPLRAM
jgi:amino-acid N-acetyltransferase